MSVEDLGPWSQDLYCLKPEAVDHGAYAYSLGTLVMGVNASDTGPMEWRL